MVKWTIELSEEIIKFVPKTAIKGQILADFIVDSQRNGLKETMLEILRNEEQA